MSYFLHYHLRLRPVETGSALLFGSGLDAAFNLLLEYKKDPQILNKIYAQSKDIIWRIDNVVIQAKLEFDRVFGAVDPKLIKYSKADADTTSLPEGYVASPGIPIEFDCLRCKAYLLIDEYVMQILPRLEEVYAVQKKIALTNEAGDTFTGVIDLIAKIDGKVYIVDNKSSSVRYAEDSVSLSGQLATYYEAMKDEYNLAGACYIVIPKSLRKKLKPVVEIKMIFGEIGEPLIDKTFREYEEVLDGVKNGQFRCTRSERGGCCSMPWPCSYRSYCESGGKDMTGLKYVDKSEGKR